MTREASSVTLLFAMSRAFSRDIVADISTNHVPRYSCSTHLAGKFRPPFELLLMHEIRGSAWEMLQYEDQ